MANAAVNPAFASNLIQPPPDLATEFRLHRLMDNCTNYRTSHDRNRFSAFADFAAAMDQTLKNDWRAGLFLGQAGRGELLRQRLRLGPGLWRNPLSGSLLHAPGMEFSGPRHGGYAREQGKTFGPPGKLKPVKVEAARRMREGGRRPVFRRVAAGLECSASTVLRVLRK